MATGWVAVACHKSPPRPKVDPPEHRFVIEGAKIERLEAHRPTYEVRARRMVMSQDSTRVHATDVTIHTRAASGAPVTVSAPHGAGDRTSETAKLWGGVQVNSQGVTLNTATAEIDWKGQRVVASSTVTARGANFDARARRGVYRIDQDKVKLDGPVSAEVR